MNIHVCIHICMYACIIPYLSLVWYCMVWFGMVMINDLSMLGLCFVMEMEMGRRRKLELLEERVIIIESAKGRWKEGSDDKNEGSKGLKAKVCNLYPPPTPTLSIYPPYSLLYFSIAHSLHLFFSFSSWLLPVK